MLRGHTPAMQWISGVVKSAGFELTQSAPGQPVDVMFLSLDLARLPGTLATAKRQARRVLVVADSGAGAIDGLDGADALLILPLWEGTIKSAALAPTPENRLHGLISISSLGRRVTPRHIEQRIASALMVERAEIVLGDDPAALAGTTVIERDDEGVITSRLSVPLATRDRERAGMITAIAEGPRVYSQTERAALAGLGARLCLEQAWSSTKDRMVEELDALRDAPRFDERRGVWNKAAFVRLLSASLAFAERTGARFSLGFIDIDDLDGFNEAHGHRGGDAAITTVARAVQLAVREGDLVAHLGADELVILLRDATFAQADIAMQRVRAAVEKATVSVPGGGREHVRVSVGVAEVEGRNAEAALAQAMKRARKIESSAAGHKESLRLPVAQIGTLGGTYRLVHEISRGAMGVIYRAEDLSLGRSVAVKMLRPDLAQDPELVGQLKVEAALLARIRHPNLVEAYAFGSDGDDTYFVMELVEGQSLSAAIDDLAATGEQFSLARAHEIAVEIGAALAALHARGVVHRDVKPDNVILDPFRHRAVLVDVGIASRHGDRARPAGTPGYVAPEILRGARATERSDVYGLAATIFALLALAPPWDNDTENPLAVLSRQRNDPPRKLAAIDPALAPVDQVLARALDPEPDRRPATVGDLIADVTGALAGLLDDHPADLTPRARLSRSSTRPLRHESRAVFLRCVPRVLGVRASQSWQAELSAAEPELAAALAPDVAPMSWISTDLMIRLLGRAGEVGRDPEELANALGRTTVRATLRRFFPAAPASLAPQPTLDAFATVWSRYHRWGEISILPMQATRVAVEIRETPASPVVCSLTSGLLTQLVLLTGGDAAEVVHDRCECRGAPVCEFQVKWTDPV